MNDLSSAFLKANVVQLEPKFIAESTDAEVYFHPNAKDAVGAAMLCRPFLRRADTQSGFNDSARRME